MASISVPIEKNRAYRPPGNGYGSNGFGGSRGGQSNYFDNGPPYFVKILNVPVNSDLLFIDDLFKSRFTKYSKGRIVIDPSSEPLRTGTVRKVAFVELNSFADQSRVLKWQDLVYRGSRRLSIEIADFKDFQHCMSFNQEHERELQEVERGVAAGRHSQYDDFPSKRREGRTGGGMPLDSIPTPPPRYQLHTRKMSQESLNLAPPLELKVPPKTRSNPFGQAKPVDIVAHQHKNEKKMIVINNTTIKTLGSLPEKDTSKTSGPDDVSKDMKAKKKQKNEIYTYSSQSRPSRKLTAAPIPEAIYGQKESLACLLSSSGSIGPELKPIKEKSSPKLLHKTTVLKKKLQRLDNAIETQPKTSPAVATPCTTDNKPIEGSKNQKDILSEGLKNLKLNSSNDSSLTSSSSKESNPSGKPRYREKDSKVNSLDRESDIKKKDYKNEFLNNKSSHDASNDDEKPGRQNNKGRKVLLQAKVEGIILDDSQEDKPSKKSRKPSFKSAKKGFSKAGKSIIQENDDAASKNVTVEDITHKKDEDSTKLTKHRLKLEEQVSCRKKDDRPRSRRLKGFLSKSSKEVKLDNKVATSRSKADNSMVVSQDNSEGTLILVPVKSKADGNEQLAGKRSYSRGRGRRGRGRGRFTSSGVSRRGSAYEGTECKPAIDAGTVGENAS